MAEATGLPWVASNFLALTPEQSDLATARVVLLPVPYDSATSYRSGARYGPAALIAASGSLEDYDVETEVDVAELGIHTAPLLEPHLGGPQQMALRIKEAVGEYLRLGKLVGVLGGDHSVVIGSFLAHREVHPNLSVLYVDAHADLRDEYMGTRWSHASGARRIQERSPLALVGVRSMAREERDHIRTNDILCVTWPPTKPGYIGDVLRHLGPEVYLSVDLDVLDPAIMSAVGTPEPGGMTWGDLTGLLRAVALQKRIVGFDVNELSPEDGPPACAYTAAKLVYRLIAYIAASRSAAPPG